MSAAFEAGQDRMASDLGGMILDLSAAARTDGEIIAALEQMIELRMELGLPVAETFGETP